MANRLPKMVSVLPILACEIRMDNGESYSVKEGDIVAIQYINEREQIVVRKGRVKDIVIVNRRDIHTVCDNVSRINLDCSEQFSVHMIEIKFKDIIKIGNIDDEFDDYEDRITELEPSTIETTGSSEVKTPVAQKDIIPNVSIPEKKNVQPKGNVVGMVLKS